jgi:hypothetical protein
VNGIHDHSAILFFQATQRGQLHVIQVLVDVDVAAVTTDGGGVVKLRHLHPLEIAEAAKAASPVFVA